MLSAVTQKMTLVLKAKIHCWQKYIHFLRSQITWQKVRTTPNYTLQIHFRCITLLLSFGLH